MPIPRFEVPQGPIDGTNVSFFVSQPYRPGSTAVFLNGQLKREDYDDGWVESDPSVGKIDLKEPPKPSPGGPDVVQVFYIDTSPALPGESIRDLKGRLRAIDRLSGRLIPEGSLQAFLRETELLSGRVEEVPLKGLVKKIKTLKASVRICK